MQFFFNRFSFTGCLISNTDIRAMDNSSNSFEFSISNTGKQELIIKSVSLSHFNFFASTPKLKTEAFPVLLMPGQMKLVKVNLNWRILELEDGQIPELNLLFTVISQKGKVYFINKLISYEQVNNTISLSKSVWVPFKSGRLHKNVFSKM